MRRMSIMNFMVTVLNPRSEKEVKEEIKKIREAGKRIRKTKASARAFLVKHGFNTKDGELTKRYRSD